MVFPKRLHWRRTFLLFAITLAFSEAHAAIKWQIPTPEELSMTAQPQVPQAAAVVLWREENVDDSTGTRSFYSRIKILNQAGRDQYSHISIDYPTQSADLYFSVTSIAGRTIHPDGTIIAFTGKPFDRMVEHTSIQITRETVFTLPDVQVGSIIEYQYSIQLNPDAMNIGRITGEFIPTFYAQTELFIRSEHFVWHTAQTPVSLTSSLPGGVSAVSIKEADAARHFRNYSVELNNVMPVPDEPDMPPRSSLVEKVVFYTQLSDSIRNAQQFWNQFGKTWSKDIDKFIGSSSKLSEIAATLTAGDPTPEGKLRKLYATVQQMENTNFVRERSEREKKVIGIFDSKSIMDVLSQKRGDDLQLTMLFVGLARASGFNAYVMAVTNRDHSHFDPHLVTFRQLNDDVAIVELNGKDLFLDPAEPLCPFGQLLWSHSNTGGLRQTANGVSLATSPLPSFKDAITRRVANLTIDATGRESGTVDMAFTGAPALRWRQNTLLGDETALHQSLETYLRNRMPKGTDVSLQSVENLQEGEKPLIVHYQVSGPLGNFTGKSSFVPAQLFQVDEASLFPDTKRILPIEFAYPEGTLDAIRLQYPSNWQVDTAPTNETDSISSLIGCNYRVQLSPNAIIFRREYILGATSIDPARYTELRNFYEKVATRDHQLVLFRTSRNVIPSP